MEECPIVLASTSARRKLLFDQIELRYRIIPSEYQEDMTLPLSPSELVKMLSHGKADEVVQRIRRREVLGVLDGYVIGSDTIVAYQGEKLGKPHTPPRAREMLRMLSGKTHEVYTGLSIIRASTLEEYLDFGVAHVTLADLSDEQIDAYVATGEPLDKAGAYAMQARAGVFVTDVKGCYSTIIGLPLPKLYAGLTQFGIDPLRKRPSEPIFVQDWTRRKNTTPR